MNLKLLLTSLLPFSLLLGQTWTGAIAGGDWGDAGNWILPPSVPNSPGANITFPDAAPIKTVILTTVSPTVGVIEFDSTASYQIQGAGTNALTFNSGGTLPVLVTFPPSNTAPHTISAPIVLVSTAGIGPLYTQNLTLSGVVSGSSGILYEGVSPSLLILSGANTFTGELDVSNGTVQCGAVGTLPAAATATIKSTGVLDLNNFNQTIRELTGVGSVTLGTATLTIATTAPSSYGGVISGAGSLVVNGTGSLTLTAANMYGQTTVSGASLILGVNNALNPASPLIVTSPGIFNLSNFSQTVASLAGNGSVALGSGTLTIGGSTSTIFSGVISGTGSFVYNGAATTTFSGANTYTGGTTISNTGTLQLGASNSLPIGGIINMTNGVLALDSFFQRVGTFSATAGSVTLGSGQLTVAPAANANFSGVISGAGSLVFEGPATWTFLAAQTYIGPTIINGGILQMGVANALSSATAVTINSPGVLSLNNNPLTVASLAGTGDVSLGTANLTLSTTTTISFSGVIGGVGGLAVNGTGTQILLGANTYSGGTAIGATATLEGTTTSLQGAIVNNGTLFFNQPFSGQYNGPLSGAGLLKKGGSGTLSLTGTPSQGSVQIISGILNIEAGANLTAPNTAVDSAGTLSGAGTMTGSVMNSGTIDPTPHLTVTGNVTFQPGSFFIADVTPTTSDLLTVLGNVTIQADSEVAIHVIPGAYQVENFYTLITAAGGPVTGQFQGFELANPFLNAQLLYNQIAPGSVTLDLMIRSISDVIKGGNAGSIAACLTQANMKKDPNLERLILSLIFFSVEKVRAILDEIQPSQLRALTTAEQTNALFAMQIVNLRTAQFDRTERESKISYCHKWNLWTSLAGNWTEQRPTEHNVGYAAPAVGVAIGFDGKVTDHLFLGFALEYGHTAFSWKENQGSCTINRMSTGPYLSYIGRFGYINIAALASIAGFNTTRKIGHFDREATSSHKGEMITSHLDAGFSFRPTSNVSISPFASLDLLFGWEDGYQERGAHTLDFAIHSSSSSLLRSEVGLRIAKSALRSHGKWVHEIKAGYVREERFHGQDLTATFKQFPCSFTVDGLYPSRSFFDVGMGLTFIFKKDRYAASLQYDGQFGEAVSIQSGIAQLLTRF